MLTMVLPLGFKSCYLSTSSDTMEGHGTNHKHEPCLQLSRLCLYQMVELHIPNIVPRLIPA